MQRIRAATATAALLTHDASLGEGVVSLLADDDTTVGVHGSIGALTSALTAELPDVLIVDDRLAHDAEEEIRQLRRRQPSIHVLYIGVSSDERCVALLGWGADDAITDQSPTMLPRLQAAMRRARTVNAASRIALGDIVFDRESRRVWVAGTEVELTPHEFSVVDCLFWYAPKPVGVDTLADFVWGDVDDAKKRSLVHAYVSLVRKKIQRSAQVVIRFVRGAGYHFTPRPDDDGAT